MFRFLLGLATGYLTMTKQGQELSKSVVKQMGSDLNKVLRDSGVIEDDNKEQKSVSTPGYTKPIQPVSGDKEQPADTGTSN